MSRGQFHKRSLHHIWSSSKICFDIIPRSYNHNFCLWHHRSVVGSYAKPCSDHLLRITISEFKFFNGLYNKIVSEIIHSASLQDLSQWQKYLLRWPEFDLQWGLVTWHWFVQSLEAWLREIYFWMMKNVCVYLFAIYVLYLNTEERLSLRVIT